MRTALDTPRTYMDALAPLQTEIIGESMTRQDQAEMVNINYIYAKTQRSEIVLGAATKPTFGDFSDNGTYDVMLEAIMAAEQAFLDLPAEERKKYNHDPALYYEKTMETCETSYQQKLDAEKAESDRLAKEKKLEKARQMVKDNPED